MKDKKKFLTIFPELENVHLIKDVGMIPYVMMKEYGYDSYILSYNTDFEYYKTELHGVKSLQLKRITSKALINVAIFLIKEGKKFEVLNLFHMSLASLIWINIYKLVNKDGGVYLKLDTNLKRLTVELDKTFFKWYLKKTLRKCEVVSCETADVQKLLKDKTGISIKHIPNGVKQSEVDFGCNKEKIIMTAARIGAYEKNSEMLLSTFIRSLNFIDSEWRLVLVGPVTDEFKIFLEKEIASNNCRERVEVVGELTDRDEIGKIYKKSMIFTMPSKWEGFSLAGVEALSKGCFLLTSDLACFREMSNLGVYGTLFKIDDKEDFFEKMVLTCQKFEVNKAFIDYNAMKKYVEEKYTWEKICYEIKEGLQKCQK